jgi:hypothetical protein
MNPIAWIAVRGKPSSSQPFGGVRLGQALAHQFHHQLVGDEVSRIHDRVHLETELAAAADGHAQDVARRDVDGSLAGHDRVRLRTLADSRRPHDDDVHAATSAPAGGPST